MSYLVLARKHRPQTFEDVIGQEHITDLLMKSIEADRMAHAYLFSGPRGIGKTSCARILAMCLNCEDGPKTVPPSDSSICQEIAEGRSFDVLEIDGASNRGIDEIRMLRENVKFAPTAGKFKIYIVDEVHMLTTEAFNALLKTLEEPPAHVKFIFATTEPNKVPATIISRCQRYDFKRIPMKKIIEGLKVVSEKEKYDIDEAALFAIAKAAQGGLRDALSILDQLSALSDKGISESDVYSMLGLVEVGLIFELIDQIGDKNCAGALQILDDIINKGKDVKQLIKEVTEHFRHLMVIKVGGKSLGKLVDYPVAVKEQFLKQCEKFELDEILTAIDTLIASQDAARITENIRMPLEVAIARLTYSTQPVAASAPNAVPVQAAPKSAPVAPVRPSPSKVLKNNRGSVDNTGTAAIKKDFDDEPEEEIPVVDIGEASLNDEPITVDIEHVRKVWDLLTSAVSKERMSVATYLQEGYPIRMDDNYLYIGFPARCNFQKEASEDQANCHMIERIFSDQLKHKISLKFETMEEADAGEVRVDDNVQSTLEAFNGKVVNRWHNE